MDAAAAVPGPVFAVDQQNVGPAIVVVVDEGAARAHGFRQLFLSEGAVVVGEVNAGLRGDVAECDLRCGVHADSAHKQHQQIRALMRIIVKLTVEAHSRRPNSAFARDSSTSNRLRRDSLAKRHRHVLVDGLALIVVFGMQLAVRAGDRLRRLRPP